MMSDFECSVLTFKIFCHPIIANLFENTTEKVKFLKNYEVWFRLEKIVGFFFEKNELFQNR